jgi:hypothetical protein
MKPKQGTKPTTAIIPFSSRVQVDVDLLEEPELLFHQSVPRQNPKVGLTDSGPAGLDVGTHRREILVDVVGSGQTMEQVAGWLEKCRSSILPRPGKERQSPAFPGFNAESKFECEFKVTCRPQAKVTATEISNIVATTDKTVGFRNATSVFLEKVKAVCEESPPDVVVCALPDEIVEYCAEASAEFLERSRESPRSPQERLFRRMARIELATGQMHLARKLFGEPEKGEGFVGRNFRRALKGLAMPVNRPLQIVTSKLFRDATDGQDLPTKAWNFCVAMYYKGGGLPWRLERLSRDTCFVGVSFFRNLGEKSHLMHTSLAQVFSGEGDAVVIRGRRFEWKHDWEKSPHLGREDAAHLIALALSEYSKATGGTRPRRVVIHKTSAFWPLERDGFTEGLSSASVSEYDLVNLQQLGIRFFREGKYPPLRGTYCRLGSEKHILFTLGYVPYLGTYPRPYVPEPWELCSHFGDTPPRRLFEEILSLTKMNFNNASGADNEPITVRFARKVGEILSYVPEGDPIQPSYRFYM